MGSGTLFVVATPIGNLGDLTDRAREVLRQVDVVAAEDTRRTGHLLSAIGASVIGISLHEHNEVARIPALLAHLEAGDDVALVSDAGTPLLADPGYRLVRAAVEAGRIVRPVPGASAITAALSVAGLPTDRFLFAGFLPARAGARRQAIVRLARETATLVLFEAPHRLIATLHQLAEGLGKARPAWVGRELTKQFECHRWGSLAELAALFESGQEPVRGEFVLVIAGAPAEPDAFDTDVLLRALLEELPTARAARIAARLTGKRRSDLYERALLLTGEEQGAPHEAGLPPQCSNQDDHSE